MQVTLRLMSMPVMAKVRLVGVAVLLCSLGACAEHTTSQAVQTRDASEGTTDVSHELGDLLLAEENPAPSAPAAITSVQYVVKGPVVVSKGRAARAWDAVVAGELTFDKGCLLLGGHPVIWTEGTSWSRAARHLVLPDGTVAELGAKLKGVGGFVDPGAFGLGQYRPRVAEVLRRCGGTSLEVVLFNAGTVPEVQPTSSGADT